MAILFGVGSTAFFLPLRVSGTLFAFPSSCSLHLPGHQRPSKKAALGLPARRYLSWPSPGL